jgi:hypothetical protein
VNAKPFLFPALPIALPEPEDSQLRRHGIEPWMLSRAEFYMCRLSAAEKFDRMERIKLQSKKLTGTEVFDLLWDRPGDHEDNGYHTFKAMLGVAAREALIELRHQLEMKKAARVARLQAGRIRKRFNHAA